MSKLYYVTVEYNQDADTFAIGPEMIRKVGSYVWDTDWTIQGEEGLDYVPTEEEVEVIKEVQNKLRYLL